MSINEWVQNEWVQMNEYKRMSTNEWVQMNGYK